MRKLLIAKNIGFCEGVRRALSMVYSELKRNNGKVFTDGPIVHNTSVINKLAALGVEQMTKSTDFGKNDALILRAHGVTRGKKEHLSSLVCTLIDATCPKILRILGLVKKYSNQGYFIILIGEHDHPETIGICSYAKDQQIMVVSDEDDLLTWPGTDFPILILAQTTCNLGLFLEISKKIKDLFPNTRVVNTICAATQQRQQEVISLAKSGCDSILVLGSEFSKNTKELVRIAMQSGCNGTILDDVDHLDVKFINNAKTLGLISGASTDMHEVIEVKKYLLENFDFY